jgi:endonuclease G
VFLLFHSTNVWAFQFEPLNNCQQRLDYQFYSLCYSKDFKQAQWTFHLLTKKSISGSQKRTSDFRPDFSALPVVSSNAYKKSGFDRGHLVPAADMKLNYTAMSESFYMTNMSPQAPSFNRGVWNALEYGFRKAVLKYGNAYVVTAPVLNLDLRRLKGGTAVPDFFYKIAYFPKEHFMMAFLLPNRSLRGENYRDYSVSVDDLEQITGIDFFADLPDIDENLLEQSVY